MSVEIDKHIPFTIEWNYTSNKNSNNYCRTGDFEKSLFAIGEDDILISYSDLGVPVFDLSQWPSNDFLDYSNRFLDCSNDFSVHLMKNRLSIRMNQDHIEKVVKIDRVLFHFGKDNILLGIDLVDINKDEHQTLKIALE